MATGDAVGWLISAVQAPVAAVSNTITPSRAARPVLSLRVFMFGSRSRPPVFDPSRQTSHPRAIAASATVQQQLQCPPSTPAGAGKDNRLVNLRSRFAPTSLTIAGNHTQSPEKGKEESADEAAT